MPFGSKKTVDSDAILSVLRTVMDPDLKRDIVSLGFVKDLQIKKGAVSFKVELTTPACPVKDQLQQECERKVNDVPGVKSVNVEMTAQVQSAAPAAQPRGAVLEGVKNVVAVASGKGGVGKSTTAANLALSLKQSGASVGLLDADVYGPSMQMMLGIKERPQVSDEKKLVPVDAHGLKVLSMALLQDPNKPVIWRGPMVHGLLQQFLRDVHWGELDYLVLDLPPGTGDAQLSISQIASISGAVIVTTPQDVSLLDARKGLETFRQLKVPVLGIVENMSYFVCGHCSERTEIFRHGGARKACEELRLEFLGEIPIDPRVVVGGDEGVPIVARDPEAPAAKAYQEFSGKVAQQLSMAAAEVAPEHPPIMPGRIDWE
ncbi:MAG: Mrp/NBP35 family ATP-binding protein [Planctomycetes bacterium]|nr:Mrp/NBP35 family ATP-binding protein [Planctomycetota bacterium]